MKVTSRLGKVIRTLGLMGIMMMLASFMAATSSASAASPNLGGEGQLAVYVVFPGSPSLYNTATVAMQTRSGTIAAKDVTDNEGNYAANFAPGTYKLIVTADGYEPYSQSVKVTSDQTTVVRVTLQSSR